MCYEQLIYLLSLALQVSGALILIVFYWGNTEHRVLNTIYTGGSFVNREEDDTVIINKERFFAAHKEVLLNRNAFIYIAAGYLLSIFGKSDGTCSWRSLIILLVASFLFVALGVLISHIIAKLCNRKDKIYQYNEIRSKLNCDVTTNAIKREIDELFK